MAVVRVAQSDLLRLRIPVPEEAVPFIHIGSEILIKVKATGKTFTGKEVRFTRALNTSTRTMLVEVDVPNPDLTLASGMYAETMIILQQRNGVLNVPANAVVRQDGHPFVLVVDRENKVVKESVGIGIEGADRVEITNGLAEGQSVIVSGQTNYQAGQVVHPKSFTI